MNLFSLNRKLAGLSQIFAYSINAKQVVPGAYDPDLGQTNSEFTTPLSGYVSSYKAIDIAQDGFLQGKIKLTIIDCENDFECFDCFEPKCGPWQGKTLKLAMRESGPVIERSPAGNIHYLCCYEV